MDIPHGWQGDENLDGVQLVSIKTGLTATMGRAKSNELPCESLCEAEGEKDSDAVQCCPLWKKLRKSSLAFRISGWWKVSAVFWL